MKSMSISTITPEDVMRGRMLILKRLKKYNPDGTPIYTINSQNIVRAVNIPKFCLFILFFPVV